MVIPAASIQPACSTVPGPPTIVVVRLFYQWPLFVTGLGFNMGCNNKRLLIATAAFKNEPF